MNWNFFVRVSLWSSCQFRHDICLRSDYSPIRISSCASEIRKNTKHKRCHLSQLLQSHSISVRSFLIMSYHLRLQLERFFPWSFRGLQFLDSACLLFDMLHVLPILLPVISCWDRVAEILRVVSCPQVPRIVRNQKVHSYVHQNPTLLLVASQMNPFPTLFLHLISILILSRLFDS
jgi:hypothetical protein